MGVADMKIDGYEPTRAEMVLGFILILIGFPTVVGAFVILGWPVVMLIWEYWT
jgi:hypothetical protein